MENTLSSSSFSFLSSLPLSLLRQFYEIAQAGPSSQPPAQGPELSTIGGFTAMLFFLPSDHQSFPVTLILKDPYVEAYITDNLNF